jgi:hypothetical protein
MRRSGGHHTIVHVLVALITVLTACAEIDSSTTLDVPPRSLSIREPATSGVVAVRRGSVQALPTLPPPSSSMPSLPGCPNSERAAVVDKAAQRWWLCEHGISTTARRPMTTASAGYGLPPVGVYRVFARDRYATGIHGEPLNRFVAFYTTSKGNRIAFHEVVDQDPATVGDLDQRGASAGCFRVLQSDSIAIWELLRVGDPVVILTN